MGRQFGCRLEVAGRSPRPDDGVAGAVFGDTNSLAAICLLLIPSLMSERTSCSRAVSVSRGDGFAAGGASSRTEATIMSRTCGLKVFSPW
jgi:hypothetical protein